MKICNKCKLEKEDSSFTKDKRKLDGLYSLCKKCHTSQYNNRPENKEKLREYKKTEKWKLYMKNYIDQRNKIPRNKLDKKIGHMFNSCIKRIKKSETFEQTVPYTPEDLKKHLESLFTEGMNWSNYGTYWEIDHIKPKSLFSYEDKTSKEFQECWALSNLQPLERLKNRIKCNKYITP